jgi:hypothetical protein
MDRKSFLAAPLLILSMAAALLSGQQAPPADAAKPKVPAAASLAKAQSQSATAGAASQRASKKEDWSVLPLEKSGLDTSRFLAVRLASWDKGDDTEELVRVQWRPFDPIELYVVRPKNVAKPPAILYLYNYLNDTDRFRDDGWCKRMTQGGFAAVGFISAVSGERIRMPRPMKEWFFSQLQESLGATTHDVQMILNYLAARGDIDMNRIGMFGQGSGASIAVLAAAVDPRIKAVELIDPWGDWPDWIKQSPVIPEKDRASFLTPEFLGKVAKLDPALYLPQLKSRNLRIEYILDDGVTPQSARKAMLAAAPKNAEIDRYKNTTAHMKAYHVNGLTGWIKAQLQSGPPQTPIMQPTAGSLAAGAAKNRPGV